MDADAKVIREKALVGALVGAFSVIVKTGCGTDGSLHSTNHDKGDCGRLLESGG